MHWKIKDSVNKNAVTKFKRRVRKIVPISEQKNPYDIKGSLDDIILDDDYYDHVKHSGEF